MCSDGELFPEEGWLTTRAHRDDAALVIHRSAWPWPQKPDSWALSSKLASQIQVHFRWPHWNWWADHSDHLIHIEKPLASDPLDTMLPPKFRLCREPSYHQKVPCWTQNNNRKSLSVDLILKNIKLRALMCSAPQYQAWRRARLLFQ